MRRKLDYYRLDVELDEFTTYIACLLQFVHCSLQRCKLVVLKICFPYGTQLDGSAEVRSVAHNDILY